MIVNNLGGTSCLELYIIANSAIRYLGIIPTITSKACYCTSFLQLTNWNWMSWGSTLAPWWHRWKWLEYLSLFFTWYQACSGRSFSVTFEYTQMMFDWKSKCTDAPTTSCGWPNTFSGCKTETCIESTVVPNSYSPESSVKDHRNQQATTKLGQFYSCWKFCTELVWPARPIPRLLFIIIWRGGQGSSWPH